jgi:hypothetical protein
MSWIRNTGLHNIGPRDYHVLLFLGQVAGAMNNQLLLSAIQLLTSGWSANHRRLLLLVGAAQLVTAAATADSPPPDIFSSVTELSKLMGREAEFLRGLEQLASKLEASARILRNFHRVSPNF